MNIQLKLRVKSNAKLFSEFAEENELTLEIEEMCCLSSGIESAARGEVFSARFCDLSVIKKIDTGIRIIVGRGSTPENAAKAYCDLIAGETLIIGWSTKNPREIKVPEELLFDLELEKWITRAVF